MHRPADKHLSRASHLWRSTCSLRRSATLTSSPDARSNSPEGKKKRSRPRTPAAGPGEGWHYSGRAGRRVVDGPVAGQPGEQDGMSCSSDRGAADTIEARLGRDPSQRRGNGVAYEQQRRGGARQTSARALLTLAVPTTRLWRQTDALTCDWACEGVHAGAHWPSHPAVRLPSHAAHAAWWRPSPALLRLLLLCFCEG